MSLRFITLGVTAVGLLLGGLIQPAVSHGKDSWDIGAYDTCVDGANKRYGNGTTTAQTYRDEIRFCCEMSGGEWNSTGNFGRGKCEAPPATAQTAPQSPGEVVQAPTAGTADPGQNPERTGDGTYEVVPVGPGGPVLYMP
ncbi:hypothetical protein ABQE93_13170 [Mycolicibacterium sp. XJ662]